MNYVLEAVMKTPWTVADSVKQEIRCNRCGQSQPFEFPMLVSKFVTWCEEFNRKHQYCDESGLWVDSWYDRAIRSWIVAVKDREGNQVGDADYEPQKRFVDTTAKRMLANAIKEEG